jgi:hypothetical protein
MSLRISHATRNRLLFHVAAIVIGKQATRQKANKITLGRWNRPYKFCARWLWRSSRVRKNAGDRGYDFQTTNTCSNSLDIPLPTAVGGS